MIKPSDLTEQTPLAEVMGLLRFGAPGPWPGDWTKWPNVDQAHIELLDHFIAELTPPPENPEPPRRGIVSCVSAKPGWSSGKNLAQGYFPGAWVMLKELRRLGCTLPVTFCHLGPFEFDPYLASLVRPLGVEVIDLRDWEIKNPMRILAGWESKIAAIFACPYDEVLFLDADNCPVQDPTPLFDAPEFRSTGAVLWPDLPPNDRPEWLPETVWRAIGMEPPATRVTDCESGQLLIDKRQCWREIAVCRWLNEHSDRFYQIVFGDKSTFTLAWRKLGTPYTLIPTPAGWNGGCILQHDLCGDRLFEHGAQNKPTLEGFPKQHCHLYQADCDRHLAELRSVWDGRLWQKLDSADNQRLEGRWFTYRRLGLGERRLRLLQDNVIGSGRARCETNWCLFGRTMAVTCSEGRLTMLLTESADGVWRGQWLEHEKCAVELEPIP